MANSCRTSWCASSFPKNQAAFWIFGFTSQICAYVVLSAAMDILKRKATINSSNLNQSILTVSTGDESRNQTIDEMSADYLQCNAEGTGVVLMAVILPIMSMKIVCPCYIGLIPYNVKVSAVAALQLSSFVIVAFAEELWLSLLGVALGSSGVAISEMTFLSLTTFYELSTVSMWSSGTGASGLIGAFAYAAMTSVGMTTRDALLTMVVMPAIMIFTYLFLLTPPGPVSNKYNDFKQGDSESMNDIDTSSESSKNKVSNHTHTDVRNGEHRTRLEQIEEEAVESTSTFSNKDGKDTDLFSSDSESSDKPKSGPSVKNQTNSETVPILHNQETTDPIETLSCQRKSRILVSLLKYIIPLTIVYFGEYFINQGLHELLYFNNIDLSRFEQYRWYQFFYQVGACLSRSSLVFFRVEKVWVFSVLQMFNVIFLLFDVFYRFIPNFWIMIVIIFWEGCLGGAAYVNTFYIITVKSVPSEREFSLGVATVGDAAGVTMASVLSVQVHDLICGYAHKIKI